MWWKGIEMKQYYESQSDDGHYESQSDDGHYESQSDDGDVAGGPERSLTVLVRIHHPGFMVG